MFDTHCLRRPECWLSPQGPRPEAETKTLPTCHLCGASLSTRGPCPNCEHERCDKCTIPWLVDGTWLTHFSCKDSAPSHGSYCTSCSANSGDGIDAARPKAEASFLTPHGIRTPTAKTGSAVKENPFIKADQTSRTLASAPLSTPRRAGTTKPRRPSDCVPGRSLNRSSTDSKPGASLGSQGGHGSVQDGQHSVCCAAHQRLFRQPTDEAGRREETGEYGLGLECGNVLGKIHQLCERAEDLHHSRHGLQRPVNASAELDRSKGDLCDARLPRGNTSPARHGRAHSLERDEKVFISRLPKRHGLEDDAAVFLSSSRKPHTIDADDVFGPVRRSGRDSPWSQEGRNEAKCQTESRRSAKRAGPFSGLSLDAGQRVIERGGNADSMEKDLLLACSSTRHTNGRTIPAVKDSDCRWSPRSKSGSQSPDRRERSTALKPQTSSANRTTQPLHVRSSSVSVVGQDLSSIAQYRPHRRGTELCLPPQDVDAKPDSWPCLKKVDKPPAGKHTSPPGTAPWSRHSLRKLSDHAGGPRTADEMATPLSWRQTLKKTAEQGRISPTVVAAPSTPASQWRQNLKTETPRPRLDRTAKTCSFCDPTSTTPPQDCSHRKATGGRIQPAEDRAESSVTPATLRVRQVERSLAQKRAEEELEASKRVVEASRAAWRGSESPDDGEAQDGVIWEDARDCSSPECRGCSWRDRYLALRGEVDKWKAELSSCDAHEDAPGHGQPSQSDKGVGDGVAQQATPDDVGIEGLTVVVHMRYKDDLVVKTDLSSRDTRSKTETPPLGGSVGEGRGWADGTRYAA